MLNVYRQKLRDIFKLDGKVTVHTVNRMRVYGNPAVEYWGLYWINQDFLPWKFKHNIRISVQGNTDKQIFAIMAHEFVHAWQTEQVWKKHGRIIESKDLEHNAAAGFTQWVEYFKSQYKINIVTMENLE